MGRNHFLKGRVEQYIVDVTIQNSDSFLLFSFNNVPKWSPDRVENE